MYASLAAWLALLMCLAAWSFPVDTSDQPPQHPPLSPPDGSVAITNPPSMIWRVDDRAATYALEMCPSPGFDRDVIRVEGLDMSFYNHAETLAEGTWHWRYFVVTKDEEVSDPSPPRSFVVTAESVPLPVPPGAEVIATMPGHPRVFVTPDTLEEFRARRDGPAKEAWADIVYRADQALGAQPPELDLKPMPADPGKKRGQVFYLRDGEPFVPAGINVSTLNGAAGRANVLSFAYLIGGERRYADAALAWLRFLTEFRIDYHLEDRAQHDTVVYCYEYGLKNTALAYDRLYELLTEDDRREVIAHVEYHGENAYRWCKGRLKLHLNYQNSHGQQCMHALVPAALALATESELAAEWSDWLVRQYVNRIAWGGNDGGYTEGQTYGHKFQYILEALAAMRTATGIDVFAKPRLRNSGDFWLYCMSLNYWWNHWGDVYSLLMPMYGNGADGYIAGLLASMTDNRALKWYSDTVVCNPAHVPFWYVSATGLKPKPPVDVPQARLFADVGQLAAYDRFYDHGGNRIFFRSSPWGSHSHAHADQNGFVLHAGGEIMACDAGYYTYYGDDYHKRFSMATAAHNSLLVNGQGQPKSINSQGRVSAFLNSPDYCLFTGGAAAAYPELLDRFDRIVLFVRPDVFIVYDELGAKEPSEFTWLLNTFEAAEIDAEARAMVVRQRDQRLAVRHVAPAELSYSQSNERPFPMLTRKFCRYTEAFPQQHTIRVATAEKREDERILAFMRAYEEGEDIGEVERVEAGEALALRFAQGARTEATIFQRRADVPSVARAGDIETDGRVATVSRRAEGPDYERDARSIRPASASIPEGRVDRWLLHNGTRLTAGDVELLRADEACDAAGYLASPGGAAQIWLKHEGPLNATLWLSGKPTTIFEAPPSRPAEAKPLEFRWGDGGAQVEISGAGETVLWVDPIIDLTRPPAPVELTITDGAGEYVVELEAAVADNGEIIAFGELDPREPGIYQFTAPECELLIQDHWDPTLSVRGRAEASGRLREGTGVFVRYAPGRAPRVRAELQKSHTAKIVSLLRNGDFEEGIPAYPPRGWTTSHPRKMGLTWPGWSQDGPAEGKSCLKFVRPKERMSAVSQPMRLRRAGKYVLRFQARGTATQANVSVSGQRGTRASVPVNPSEVWQEYRTELDAQPGYCTVAINFGSGGEPDQVLWVDDMEFGYVVR